MSKTANVVFQAYIDGQNIKDAEKPPAYTFPNSPYEHHTQQVFTGVNLVPMPVIPSVDNLPAQYPRYVRILPPPTSSLTKLVGYQASTGAATPQTWIDMTNETWLAIPTSISPNGIVCSVPITSYVSPSVLTVYLGGSGSSENLEFYWY